jgi:hypothetical protein
MSALRRLSQRCPPATAVKTSKVTFVVAVLVTVAGFVIVVGLAWSVVRVLKDPR